MFHPLLPNLTEIKAPELEIKISELTKKYWISARSGNGYLCEQILVAIEAYKTELQNKNLAANRIVAKNGDKDLDDLIKIS
jgi:hypothetical protein